MMESKNQTVGVNSSYRSRPLANYHSNVWGDRFLVYFPQSCKVGEKKVVEELIEEVKRELIGSSNDYMGQLKMVDAIQRLGIDYHFEKEIDEALQNLFEKFDDYCKHNHDLYTTSLAFRLLRQHGYRISCKNFDKFKDEKGGFKIHDNQEIIGVLEFFEATHLRIHNEEILDHAYVFTRNYLESVLPSLRNPDAEQVRHALYQYSIRRGLPRLEARHFISIYDQYNDHHRVLLKLAKLDFNLLQSQHKKELSEIYGWWKDLGVSTKLSYARDRIVETYFWIMGVYFEPQYALARKILTKLQGIASLFDDTYDAYAYYEELQLFTEAIERWDISCLNQLPDYMKIIYKALLEFFEEIDEEMIKQGTPYRTNYGIEAMKVMARNYFAEVKWREEKYIPKAEEYMSLATASTAYTSLMIISFLGMGDIVKKEAFDWVLSQPDMVRATLIICRLIDDIAGHETERKREHIPSAVECYMEEHNVTKKETVFEFNNRVESAWKDVNEAFIKPTKFPAPILYRILNFARVIEVIYSKGDWYTNVGPEMQSFINQLLVDPLP